MSAQEIQKVLIIGNGAMAQHIGVQCALAGCDVVLYVRNAEKNWHVWQRIEDLAAQLEQGRWLSEDVRRAALARISLCNDIREACKGVDLVSESIAEDTAEKRKTWALFAPHLPGHAVLTTNTSSLLPSEFAEASGAPDRFLAWHFHLTVFRQNLADIMPVSRTDPKYVKLMVDFSRRIRQNACVLKREHPGFLANNMLFAVLYEALDLLAQGVADPADIDKAWMAVRLADAGPFGIMDKIGLDVVMDVLPEKAGKQRLIEPLAEMVAKGKLGVKTGAGFYTYPDPAYAQEEFVLRAAPIL